MRSLTLLMPFAPQTSQSSSQSSFALAEADERDLPFDSRLRAFVDWVRGRGWAGAISAGKLAPLLGVSSLSFSSSL